MQLQNQKRAGDICSQSIALEWLHFGNRSRRQYLYPSARKPLDELAAIGSPPDAFLLWWREGRMPQRSAGGATALRTPATSPALVPDAEFPQLLRIKLTSSATSRSLNRQAKEGIANCAGVCAVRGVCEPESTIEINEIGFAPSTTGLPANLGNT